MASSNPKETKTAKPKDAVKSTTKAKVPSAKAVVSKKVVQPPAGSKVRPMKRAAPVAAPLVKQPSRAVDSPVRIFQIYFEPWQREVLDPAFYPLDNSGVASELMEFAVFEQLHTNAATKGAKLWGALSWRFGEKTGMQGVDWVKQVVDHPGHDVYYCNPHLENEAVFHNMWLQGEVSHPHFLEIAKAFFAAAGLDDKEISALHPSSSYSAANSFVATPKFWDRYIAFIRQTLATVEQKMNPKLREVLHSKVADSKGLHGGATYVPFIVERLFGYFMRTEGKDLKAFKITLPERERELNVHLKLLREMKDVAHQTKSAWMAACWVNYRNLYLSQTHSKAWCARYLRKITPTEVRFV